MKVLTVRGMRLGAFDLEGPGGINISDVLLELRTKARSTSYLTSFVASSPHLVYLLQIVHFML